MTYRDDHDAAVARVEALQRELADERRRAAEKAAAFVASERERVRLTFALIHEQRQPRGVDAQKVTVAQPGMSLRPGAKCDNASGDRYDRSSQLALQFSRPHLPSPMKLSQLANIALAAAVVGIITYVYTEHRPTEHWPPSHPWSALGVLALGLGAAAMPVKHRAQLALKCCVALAAIAAALLWARASL